MYFLGVDPGIRKLGFAIINDKKEIFELATIINEKNGLEHYNIRRIFEIGKLFDNILNKYEIKGVCIEKIFFTKFNKANAEFIYGVRGLLLSKFYEKNLKITDITPKEIKKYITGRGNAGKIAMQNCVQKLFSLKKPPTPHDSADALGMAWISFKLYK